MFGRRHGSSILVDGNGMHLRGGRLSSVGFCEERIGGGASVSVAEDEQDSVRRKNSSDRFGCFGRLLLDAVVREDVDQCQEVDLSPRTV